jgi:hypothetical protein
MGLVVIRISVGVRLTRIIIAILAFSIASIGLIVFQDFPSMPQSLHLSCERI